MNVKSLLVLLCVASSLAWSVDVQAKGCLKGAAAGAVAGHYAGHHAVVGAVGGCIVGRHMANKKDAEAKDAKAAHAASAPMVGGAAEPAHP